MIQHTWNYVDIARTISILGPPRSEDPAADGSPHGGAPLQGLTLLLLQKLLNVRGNIRGDPPGGPTPPAGSTV